MTKKLQKVETIKEQISKAIDGHLTPEYIERRVHEIISKNTNDVILKLLGFDSTWHGGGKYEVDHCNGRSGESFVGDYIRKTCQDKLKEWTGKIDLVSIELPKSALDSLRKEFIQRYEYILRNALLKQAEALATKAAEDYLRSIISEVPTINDVLEEKPITKKEKISDSNKPKLSGF